MKSILMAAKVPRRLIAKGLGAPVRRGALPVAMSNFAAGSYNGKIDVFGGLTAGSKSRKRQQYDIATGQWTASADLFNFTWGAGITTAEGFWVTAGLIDDAYNNKMYLFDRTALGSFTAKQNLDGGLRIEARMTLREKQFIHVAGGYTQGGPKTSNIHSTYNIKTGQWITRTTTPLPVNGHVVGMYKEQLYLAGGYSDDTRANSARFSRYDPAGDNWIAMPNIPAATSWVNGAVVGNLLVVGAISDAKVVVFVFDFETNQWSRLDTDIPQRWAGEWVADDNGIWLLGGCSSAPGATNYNNLAKFSDMYYFPLTY